MDYITIQQGDWVAKIAPLPGGNVISLSYNGENVLVPLQDEKQLAENPYLQGAPILLPANRTDKGRFTFEGETYTLPVNEAYTGAHLHGLVHRCAFTVTEQTPTAVSLVFENHGEVYPFPFRLQVTYACMNDAFSQRYTITNTGHKRMPFTFALHTTFIEPTYFSVPIDACQKKDEKHIPIGGYFPLTPEESNFATGSPSKGVSISGYYRACGHTATIGSFEYRVSKEFDHWILFNGNGTRGLLCVEPQCGAVNGLNSEKGKYVLNSGETLTLSTEIRKRTL